jgi:hypothetical protein
MRSRKTLSNNLFIRWESVLRCVTMKNGMARVIPQALKGEEIPLSARIWLS